MTGGNVQGGRPLEERVLNHWPWPFGRNPKNERLLQGSGLERAALASPEGQEAIEQAEIPHLHLHIDARGQARRGFAQPGGAEIEVESNGIRLLMSPETAPRAQGILIDFVETAQGRGLTLRRAQTAQVQQMSVQELRRLMEAGEPFELIDVRSPEERGIAHIEGSELLDEDVARRLASLDRGARLIFHCHLGGRSQAAAEHFAELGFENVHNLAGGIDAWSREIDPSVPTY